ncbi:MAG: exodeoxyribonuclease V subunit gamma [Sedimenticola sp.]|nr:exodeoxyribonuclease V subunit gamma [Sedimenticola sp.]
MLTVPGKQITPMLHLYHSNRLERLADELAEILTIPLAAPLAAETVVVQHQGMGRWLSLALSQRRGLCANTEFLLPAGFIWQLLRQLLDNVPESDRYQPLLMQWWLFERLAKPLTDRSFEPLKTYLQADDELMRFQLAGEIANCFDQYLVYRPDWIKAWQAGKTAVPGDRWQSVLWRELCSARKSGHWVDLLERLNASNQAGALHAERLPERVCLFALSALSPGYLDIVNTAAQMMDVHLFVLNPAEGHWMDLVSEKEKSQREMVSATDALYLDLGNPLLASLGKQGRDFFSALIAYDPGAHEHFLVPEKETVLHQLQRDVLYIEDTESAEVLLLDAADRSIEFHACHSPMRELEVLHDQLLDRFSKEPDLEPSDILVMTPDMDTYAPYIEAVFTPSVATTTIPFTLSDRSQLSESPTVSLFLQLLTQAGGRYPVDQILSLLEQPVLHRRFGIEASDLPQIHRWVRLVGIRWSKDGSDRATLGLPVTGQNSWQSGLDRLLLGYAFPGEGDELFKGRLPCAEVEGSEAHLLGLLIGFLTALFEVEQCLLRPHTLPEWKASLNELLDRFLAPDETTLDQVQALRNAIARLVLTAEQADFTGVVSRELVISQLRQQLSLPVAGRFLGGGVTFCALTPLRALPFKVICMIGMNDGVYPRDKPPVGFDLMTGNHRLGDRSRRADDRYLFLETLLSARSQLYISYTGRDVRDNSRLPPSVLVSELMDYLDSRFKSGKGQKVSALRTTEHPLQAYNERYFRPGSGLFSYSRSNCEGALALQKAAQSEVRPFISESLSEPDPSWRQVELNQLISFYLNPVRYLLNRRLGITLAAEDELPDSRDPFELDYFSRSALFERLVAAEAQGRDRSEILAVERARGELPHGVTGDIRFQELIETAVQFNARLTPLRQDAVIESVTVNHVAGDLYLSGQLENVQSNGLLGYSYHKLPDTRLLGLWIRHLVLNVSAPLTVTPMTRWLSQEGLLTFQPVEHAETELNKLLTFYWQGLQEPLPLFPKSARIYVTSLQQGKPKEYCLGKAQSCWLGGFSSYAEYDNAYYRLAFPDADVLDAAFEKVSEAVFGPLLAALEVS